jgi:hypothetical protein
MKTFSNDRELYLAYRLGELSQAERDPIEDRMLRDSEFSDRMQEAEYDLLDDYRAGRLNSVVRLQVERAFNRDELTQPWTFALRRNGKHASVPSRPAPRFSLAFRFACAVTALLLIAVAGWVLAVRLHSVTVFPTQAARTTPAPSSSPQGSSTSPTPTAGSSSHLPGETAVLLLAPAVTRGGPSSQLELHTATRTVMVQWLVPSDLAGYTFSLLVQQNGKEVALVPASNVQHIGGSDVEEFSLPRAAFSAVGPHVHYAFFIRKSGIAPATEAEFDVRVSGDFNH